MENLPNIKVTDINLDVVTNEDLITEIDGFRFMYKKGTDYVTVYLESNCDLDWLDEVEIKSSNLGKGDLERIALNWIFKHVEIVKEEESNHE